MKLEKVLDKLNFVEKNSFLKIIDGIIANNPKNKKEIDKILSDSNRELKNIDNINVAKVFEFITDEFTEYILGEFKNTTSQFDILSDIISRDGNCILKQDWFSRLYELKLKTLKKNTKEFEKFLKEDDNSIDETRKRDYKIYHACVQTAYNNDLANNQEQKVTLDEQSILITLANNLELSQEEVKLINYMIIPIINQDIDSLINDLKSIGVVFYSRKLNTIYIADEIVRILRKVRGKEIADKYFRRVLRLLREPQINLICKKHNIERKLSIDEKIKEIINEGIPLSIVLSKDIHKDGTTLPDKKKFINELCDKGLNISPKLKGITLEDKIDSLIQHFEAVEKDDRVSISIDGYEKLLIDIDKFLPKTKNYLKNEFELQEENILSSKFLLDYNIKPQDVLELIPQMELESFCKVQEIKVRGNLSSNILDSYKDSENVYLENYENIGYRKHNELKENGINLKESELGIRFEDLTKAIFEKLGFNVNEKLRKKLNTAKDKIDIVLQIDEKDFCFSAILPVRK